MTKLLSRFLRRSPKPRQWIHRKEDLPWFDQPDAHEVLTRRHGAGEIDDWTRDFLAKFIDEGYTVAEGVIAPELCDALNAEVDALWTSDRPRPGVAINQTPHEDVVKMDPEEKRRFRDEQEWRILGFNYHSDNARAIYEHPRLRELATLLYGRPAQPDYSLTFMYGSEHGIHQDLPIFAVHPLNHIMGVWVALEDITPECGPLFYQPGSHREPLWEGFTNYPQTNIRNAPKDLHEAYVNHLLEIGERYPRRQFLAKQGDVLFWHAMLLHGGDAIKDRSHTRRSFVMHFIPPGMNKSDELVGEFRW